MTRLFNHLCVACLTLLLAACMQPSAMQEQAGAQLADVGLLNHYKLERSASIRIEQDALIYIAQDFFPPLEHKMHSDTVLVEETFFAFLQYFPHMLHSAEPLALDQAMLMAHEQRADYLLYTRLAQAKNKALLRDRAVIQVMLYELGSGKMIEHGSFQIRSGYLTSLGKKPEDFLRKPMQDYARQLLGMSR